MKPDLPINSPAKDTGAPPPDADSVAPKIRTRHPVLGGLFCAFGAFIVLSAANVIPTDESHLHAPRWIVGLAGATFVFGGMSVLSRRWYLSMAVGVLLAFSLGGVALWACLYSDPESWTGDNIPFLSPRANGMIAKVGCGLGAVLIFSLGGRAVWLTWKGPRGGQPGAGDSGGAS